MTYIASVDEQERKLRLAESAAASAVLNGCDPEEVRHRVEVGIAEALQLNGRRPPARTPDRPVTVPRSGALEALQRAAGL